MNVSKMIERMKMELGIYKIALPIEGNIDDYIMEVVETMTIPTYSQFFPKKEEYVLDISSTQILSDSYDEVKFKIPDMILQGRDVNTIIDVVPESNTFNGQYFSASGIYNNNPGMYTDMMLGQAAYDLLSVATPTFSWDFINPNILVLYNMSSFTNKVKITIGFDHPRNLMSISPDKSESFYELALTDVKVALYNTLKFYDGAETAYGNISLKIDEWSGASNERKELVERYRQNHHHEQPVFFFG